MRKTPLSRWSMLFGLLPQSNYKPLSGHKEYIHELTGVVYGRPLCPLGLPDTLQGVIDTRYCSGAYRSSLCGLWGAVGYDLGLKNLTKISVGI